MPPDWMFRPMSLRQRHARAVHEVWAIIAVVFIYAFIFFALAYFCGDGSCKP